MTSAIARVIAKEGAVVLLRRQAAAPTLPVDFGVLPWGEFPWDGLDGFDHVTLRGVVQQYRPQDLVGNVRQGDRRVIVSDAEIARLGWPGPPRQGDWLLMDGLTFSVQSCDTRALRGQPAIHILQVRGG